MPSVSSQGGKPSLWSPALASFVHLEFAHCTSREAAEWLQSSAMLDRCLHDYERIFVGLATKSRFGDTENPRKFSDRGEERCGDYGDIP